VTTADDYRRALETAIREYETLTRQRGEIDERVAQLTQTIGSLTRLCGLTATVEWGLTDACRLVIRNAGRSLTAVEVRDRLASIGFDLSKYSNELASIHTVLKRLNQAGEIHLVPGAKGKQAVMWVRPPRSIALSRADIDALLERKKAASAEPPAPERPTTPPKEKEERKEK
jgi:hypothetical protein